MIHTIRTILAAFFGGLLSRWHGGGFFKAPKWLKNLLWALPIASGCAAKYFAQDYILPIVAIVFALVLAGSWITKTTGKGGGQDLAFSPEEPGNGREIEKLEYLVHWLYDRLPRYWYDALILLVNGTFAAAVPTIALYFVSPAAGAVMMLGSFAVPLGYMIGWWIFPNHKGKGLDDLNEATEIGELLGGFFFYCLLAIALAC